MRRKAYSGRAVNEVDVPKLAAKHPGQPAWVGVDTGKYDLRLVVQWSAQEFERPWRVQNPLQVRLATEQLKALAAGRELVIAMEPSGSYGDAFRQAVHDAGLVLHRVSPKAAHDHAEVFDGVPSQHDGKDAAVVADLARIGRSKPWAFAEPAALDQELELWVDRAESSRRILQLWAGRLEGKLARHWPEVIQQLKVQSPTLLKAILEYGGPEALGKDPQAAKQLKRFGRGYLQAERIEQVIAGARQSVGVRMTELDRMRLREYATAALAAREQLKRAKRELAKRARKKPALAAMGEVVGLATACVLWVCLGDPADYPCGAAYLKAMGLNLTERSSGIYQGQLKISKRGFAVVRYWMYLAALRWCRREPVQSWYGRKKQKDGGKGSRALTGIMRRLGLAVHAVGAHGLAFEPQRLFTVSDQDKKGRCPTVAPV